ncbi:ATP-dependent 6-phosphofructokinase [bacterium]|nr:ATP-dependent 6-phosphofructokinase [bacterium]
MSVQPPFANEHVDTRVEALGERTIDSPLSHGRFVRDDDRVSYDLDARRIEARFRAEEPLIGLEEAGPRAKLFFDPRNTKAAIVTCGGLCPGLNDVIRSIHNTLTRVYGVRIVKGVQFGYEGLDPASGLPLLDLGPREVRGIHEDGGTMLGSSRGPKAPEIMVETLHREDIRILFTVGGDGTLRGALGIRDEIRRRGLKIAVVAVPKTIDNDISMVARTFGYDSAVSAAQASLKAAHVEAQSFRNGIGIVKLMGRDSGFVAAAAALACADANFVLVPEVPFEIEGPNGLASHVEDRLRRDGHAMLVVAEGAGQELFDRSLGTDPSGNRKLGDIGALLRDRVGEVLRGRGVSHTIKYIDPSYVIRSVPAVSNDSIFCTFLGQHAAHAGMAGKTGVLIGSWSNLFVHVPIEAAIARRKRIDPAGILWTSVLEATGQPQSMVNGADAAPVTAVVQAALSPG